MEILVRMAEEKYINKYKSTTNYFEALKMLWNDHCQNVFNKNDSQNWRQTRLWNEDCDFCIKYYQKIITQAYKIFSKKKVKPG